MKLNAPHLRLALALAASLCLPAYGQEATPSSQADEGRLAFDSGDFARAVEIFSACRAADPADPAILAWLGSAQLKAGLVTDAVTTLQEAVQLAPRDPVVRTNLGTALVEVGDRDGATASYRAALAVDPAFEDARHNLAVLLAEDGKYEEMLELFASVLNDPQRRAAGHLTVGLLLEISGRTRNAVSHYQSAHAFDPDNGEATECLARAMIALEEMDRATDLLEAEAAAGRATPPLREMLGIVYQAQGRYAEAAALLSVLRDEGHDTFELHRALGISQAQVGDFAESASSFQRALGHRPNEADVENNLGWVYAEQLLDDKAEDHLVAALQANSNLTTARKTLVTIYRRQGRTREVVAQLEAILNIDPTDAQALRALVRAALTAPEAKLTDETLALLSDHETTDAAFLGALGCLLIQRADYNGAARVLTRAVALNGADPDLHNNLGVAHERLGLLEEALDDYRIASRLDPDHVEAAANHKRVEEALLMGGGQH